MNNIKIVSLLLGILFFCSFHSEKPSKDHIQPWPKNPWYWQYKSNPVLLLGGSNDDNLFQWPAEILVPHLDSMKMIGANYLRNTMSDRKDKGFELYPYKKLDNGKYNLEQWNEEYWQRFEFFLKETAKRDIIVQIEVWDRFDYSGVHWLTNPYNPANNNNYHSKIYPYIEAGLERVYPLPADRNAQPFFFTVPELLNNEELLKFQQAFMKKMLSISLQYGNVLYCIENESSGAEAWPTYWAEFIKFHAGDNEVYITQMWWYPFDMKSLMHKRTLDHPERYQFFDMSQNSFVTGYKNWENAQNVFEYIKNNPRPLNSTKIYGSNKYEPWLNKGLTTEHAMQTFFRNVLGGFASSRFHRPSHGIGLSQNSINCIKTIRKIEEHIKMWELTPMMDLLVDVKENEAYLSAKEGEYYLIYFTGRGNVKLDLREHESKYLIKWINVENAEWEMTSEIKGGRIVNIAAKNENSSFAILKKI